MSTVRECGTMKQKGLSNTGMSQIENMLMHVIIKK